MRAQEQQREGGMKRRRVNDRGGSGIYSTVNLRGKDGSAPGGSVLCLSTPQDKHVAHEKRNGEIRQFVVCKLQDSEEMTK